MSLYLAEKQNTIQQKWAAFRDTKYNDTMLEFGMSMLEFGMSLPKCRDEISRRCEIQAFLKDPTREVLHIDGNPVLEVSMHLDLFRNSMVFKSRRLDK